MTWGSRGNRCSCCEDSSFPGGEKTKKNLILFVCFCFKSKKLQNIQENNGGDLVWQASKAAGKKAAFQGRHSHGWIAVKLCLIPFAGSHNVVQRLEVRRLFLSWVVHKRGQKMEDGRYRTRLRLDLSWSKYYKPSSFQQSLWLHPGLTLHYLTAIFTLATSTALCQKYIFFVLSALPLSFLHTLILSQSLNVKPWQRRHFLRVCLRWTKQQISQMTFLTAFGQIEKKKKSYKQEFCSASGSSDWADTYLYDVINQRVTKHPVQVNALVLENVLVWTQTHGDTLLRWRIGIGIIIALSFSQAP